MTHMISKIFYELFFCPLFSQVIIFPTMGQASGVSLGRNTASPTNYAFANGNDNSHDVKYKKRHLIFLMPGKYRANV